MANGTPPAPVIRREGVLHIGAHSLEDLAERYGTPLYVYDGLWMLDRLRTVRSAFEPLNPLVAYSVKANSNGAVLRLFARAGTGADIVSGGELFRCLRAGIPPGRIVFAGVGKTADEMRYALESGIMSFHVESAQELEVLGDVAAALGVVAPVAMRINPDVEPRTHEFTRTGQAHSKFGVSPDVATSLYRRAQEHPSLSPVGADVHIGSQIREVEPFLDALDTMLEVVDRIRREFGISVDYVDLGGGFGIADHEEFGGERGGMGLSDGKCAGPACRDAPSGEAELDLAALAHGVQARMNGRALALIVEPGRFLVGDAGVLLARVLYVKRSGGKTIVVTDAGMTELIRPSHYGGVHPVSLVRGDAGGAVERVDLVGPVCEQGDFLARERELAVPGPGSILCVHRAGAYGLAMASNYNSRLRPAEVMLQAARARVIRRREDIADLVRDEIDE